LLRRSRRGERSRRLVEYTKRCRPRGAVHVGVALGVGIDAVAEGAVAIEVIGDGDVERLIEILQRRDRARQDQSAYKSVFHRRQPAEASNSRDRSAGCPVSNTGAMTGAPQIT
jgi:hypothetical protein